MFIIVCKVTNEILFQVQVSHMWPTPTATKQGTSAIFHNFSVQLHWRENTFSFEFLFLFASVSQNSPMRLFPGFVGAGHIILNVKESQIDFSNFQAASYYERILTH